MGGLNSKFGYNAFFSWLICTINGMLDRVIVINEFIGVVGGTFFSIICVPFLLTGVISVFKKQRFKPRAFFIYSSWVIAALEIIGSFSK